MTVSLLFLNNKRLSIARVLGRSYGIVITYTYFYRRLAYFLNYFILLNKIFFTFLQGSFIYVKEIYSHLHSRFKGLLFEMQWKCLVAQSFISVYNMQYKGGNKLYCETYTKLQQKESALSVSKILFKKE